MKLLIYRWNAWNQKDIEDSLFHFGHELSYIEAVPKSPEEDTIFVDMLTEKLRQEQPELLFSVNYFPVLAEACHLSSIPYVCWNCDGSLLAMYHESVFYDTNFIFTFDRACVSRFQTLGVSNIWYLPLGVNAHRLNRLFTRQTHIGQYDISFIGSLYQKNSFDDITDKLPPYLAGYLDGALSAQQAISGGNMLEVLLTPAICEQLEEITQYHCSERSFADIRQLFSSTVLGFKAANLQRCQILNALSKAGRVWTPPAQVHLFTTDQTQELPLVKIHPPVDYFQEMPWIFRNSSINLNSTVPTIQTGIPLRIWDILGSGGFLLTDYQEDLFEYFQSEKHLSIFEDMDELLDKANFYLKHDELCQEIARESQKLVCANHTWDIRLTQIFHRLHTTIL